MAMNFPSSPTNGQVFVPTHALGSGPIYVYNSSLGTWRRNAGTALPTNKLINGAMQVSQEMGDNFLTTSSQAYAADQWALSVLNPPGYDYSCQRTAMTTPRGSKYRLKVVTLKNLTAANNFVALVQSVEGNRIGDLKYGTSNAMYSVLRLGFNAPAGNYFVKITGSVNRDIPFTVTNGGVDTEYSIVIDPFTTGTWPADSTYPFKPRISIADTSVAGTINSTYYLFDVGWYADPNMTGVAPEFQSLPYEDDLRECQRYWYKSCGTRGVSGSATALNRLTAMHPVPMRVAPTAGGALTKVGALRSYDGGAVGTVSAIADGGSDTQALALNATTTGLTLGRSAGLLVDGVETVYVAVSAR